MARILIVEDEDKLRRALQRGLIEEGYDVVAVDDGESGLAHALAETFDCLILDVMLPSRDGFQVLGELRAAGRNTPFLLLTARGSLEDRVLGLDLGADDYLPKPFAWMELLARLRACLRRQSPEAAPMLHARGLTLDCISRKVSSGARVVELTVRECELLQHLMRRPGQVVSRHELARQVWGDPQASLTNVIDVYINYLRKKLERLGVPGLIGTVRGVGYLFQD